MTCTNVTTCCHLGTHWTWSGSCQCSPGTTPGRGPGKPAPGPQQRHGCDDADDSPHGRQRSTGRPSPPRPGRALQQPAGPCRSRRL